VVRGNKLYPYIPLSTRAERKKQLVEQKAAFEKGNPKHRYVGIYAPNRRIKRAILEALRWKTFPYPKRGSELAKLPAKEASLNVDGRTREAGIKTGA
jgi:hypothetical protein